MSSTLKSSQSLKTKQLAPSPTTPALPQLDQCQSPQNRQGSVL